MSEPAAQPPERAGALPLERAGALFGSYAWMERQLFHLTGSWAGTAQVAPIQILFDELSVEHAWHAELFTDRLPVLDWVDRESLIVAPGPSALVVFDALGEADLAEGSVRLGVLCRAVLPRLVAAYERHLDRARPVADQPAMRALRLVLADERAAIARGTELLDGEVGVLAEAQRLDACERFEDILGGTPAGLVPWTDD